MIGSQRDVSVNGLVVHPDEVGRGLGLHLTHHAPAVLLDGHERQPEGVGELVASAMLV